MKTTTVIVIVIGIASILGVVLYPILESRTEYSNAYVNDSSPSTSRSTDFHEHSKNKREYDNTHPPRRPDEPDTGDRNVLLPVDRDEADLIEDEVIFRFKNRSDMERFLAEAGRYGYETLGINEKWHSVRLRLFDAHDFNNLVNIEPKPLNYGANYEIRIPDSLRERHGSDEHTSRAYLPFGSGLRKWLGMRKSDGAAGSGVTVAVIDTGVVQHPTFREGAIEHINLLDGEHDVTHSETGSHGTAMASVIAGGKDEAPGMAPDSKILSIRALDESGTGDTFTVALGILAAVDGGADVINASLGTYGNSHELREAVAYAADHDVLIVAAAGNDGIEQIAYPARYRDVIAVGGVDPLEQHPEFSNVGDELDISAPATGIPAAYTEKHTAAVSGTSPATAVVSGIIAGLMSDYPDFSGNEIKSLVIDYSNDVGPAGHDPIFGHGIPDLNRIANRNETGIVDMAIGSQYNGEVQGESERVPLIVTAQNRGTQNLRSVVLRTQVGDVTYSETFHDVAVGETISATIDLPRDELIQNGKTQWTSTVDVTNGKDTNTTNNTKSSVISVNIPNVN